LMNNPKLNPASAMLMPLIAVITATITQP
jgi:hypothetical protein